jgi:hypothetical protein
VLGGAERIVMGQLKGGEVKVFSSGSALDGGPAMYLHSAASHPKVSFEEMASFIPFGEGVGGVSVATTSTTEGADLLVSGLSAEDGTPKVYRFELARSDEAAKSLSASLVGQVTLREPGPVALGGD